HDLGQVDEREDRPVEVREVRPESRGLVVREVLRRVQHGRLMVPVEVRVRADVDGGYSNSRNAPGTTSAVSERTRSSGTPSTSSATGVAVRTSTARAVRTRIRG